MMVQRGGSCEGIGIQRWERGQKGTHKKSRGQGPDATGEQATCRSNVVDGRKEILVELVDSFLDRTNLALHGLAVLGIGLPFRVTGRTLPFGDLCGERSGLLLNIQERLAKFLGSIVPGP